MTYLAIETAYDVCGVALVNASGVEALEEQVAPRRHNELLAVSVDRLLADSGRRLSDLDGIALSVGPGSFTGLRIGMSYAKGLALGTGLPIIPVPTLPSLLAKNGFTPLFTGTRSRENKRGIVNRAFHRLVDWGNQGTWLELVAKKSA